MCRSPRPSHRLPCVGLLVSTDSLQYATAHYTLRVSKGRQLSHRVKRLLMLSLFGGVASVGLGLLHLPLRRPLVLTVHPLLLHCYYYYRYQRCHRDQSNNCHLNRRLLSPLLAPPVHPLEPACQLLHSLLHCTVTTALGPSHVCHTMKAVEARIY